MPTYEYECKRCNNHFEVFQNISAEPLKECSKCGGELKRVIGAGAGIIFKGSGFYATDYRKGKKDGKSCPVDSSKDVCKTCPVAENNNK